MRRWFLTATVTAAWAGTCLLCGCSRLHHAEEPPAGPAAAEEEERSVQTMTIQPRYARLYTDPGTPLAERNYDYATLDWEVRLDRCAVVCVDCWAWHFTEETLERIDTITRQCIAPVLQACRDAGMLVIHAPADPVASRHPNLVRMRPEDSKAQPEYSDSPQWPPQEFRAKSGDYARFARPPEPQYADRAQHRDTKRTFHEAAQPQGDEPVIVDGEDLHRICAERGILHLFFVGFNTNACVMMRDYGLPAMAGRGYHTVLLRDCTTGMEIAETVDGMVCTKGTIATIEQFLGYTMTSDQLIKALNSAE